MTVGDGKSRFTRAGRKHTDKWYILEAVPVGVCQQCGEKFFKPEVAKTIDQILQEGKASLRTIEVPCIRL